MFIIQLQQFKMSLYPSLEDMKVDQMAKVIHTFVILLC